MRQFLRYSAIGLLTAVAVIPASAQPTETWKAVTEAHTAAFIRVPGPEAWPAPVEHGVDDGQRRAAFPPAKPPAPEEIKLVVRCGVRDNVAVYVTGLSYAEPRIIGGLAFEIDGHELTRVAALDFSESDHAYFPSTLVTQDDPLVERLRKGWTLKARVVGNAADGRTVEVPLKGSRRAIDEALTPCRPTS